MHESQMLAPGYIIKFILFLCLWSPSDRAWKLPKIPLHGPIVLNCFLELGFHFHFRCVHAFRLLQHSEPYKQNCGHVEGILVFLTIIYVPDVWFSVPWNGQDRPKRQDEYMCDTRPTPHDLNYLEPSESAALKGILGCFLGSDGGPRGPKCVV